ncbi:MAG: hypothetical protein LBC86_03325, partial [Oscillospiraceae bacterium]|nr:hypothetical protein [Oscillospiraceae bacterium]
MFTGIGNSSFKCAHRCCRCCCLRCRKCCCKRPKPPKPPLPPEPQIITTAEHLNAVRNNLSGNYKLGNNIDLTEYLSPDHPGYNSEHGWKPVGSGDFPFTGTFDGNGYKITGLWLNRGEGYYAGLFGLVEGVIKNLSVETAGVGVRGNNNVGVLA